MAEKSEAKEEMADESDDLQNKVKNKTKQNPFCKAKRKQAKTKQIS